MISLKVRLEPNNAQRTKMFQAAGVARWAYNWVLGIQRDNYAEGNDFIQDGALRKNLTKLKQSRYTWLNTVSAQVPKQAIKDACAAYKKFFKQTAKYPKFKSKRKSRPSFYVDTHKIKVKNNKIYIEKIGWVRMSEKGRIPTEGPYYNPRVTHNGVHWFVSVGVEQDVIMPELTGVSLGIDLGLKDLAICSDGKVYKNINKGAKLKKLRKRLRRLQRRVSRKYQINKRGLSYVKTSNIVKLEQELRKLHIRIGNISTDYRHKTTSEIVKTKPSRIVMEDLNVRGMMKDRHIAKATAQQSLNDFAAQVEYKARRQGTEFVKVSRWFPSSKLCSDCGHKKLDLKRSDRTYVCEHCGLVIDRDLNASLNLANYRAA